MIRKNVLKLFAGFLATACGGGPMPKAEPLRSWNDVSSAEWLALSQRRIFFGHQSVGRNILEGVAAVLGDHPQISLAVKETKDWAAGTQPGLYHANVGRNLFPREKADEFVSIVSAGGNENGIAMLKFCYVDLEGKEQNYHSVFERYEQAVEEVRAKHPGLTLVHLTMPLTTGDGKLDRLKNKVLGRSGLSAVNALRNGYNALLIERFGGKEPLFDIAALESRKSDGSFQFFHENGKVVYEMAPENTDDGGHLTDAAKRRIAEQFLIFLAKLPSTGTHTATAGTAQQSR